MTSGGGSGKDEGWSSSVAHAVADLHNLLSCAPEKWPRLRGVTRRRLVLTFGNPAVIALQL